jgi:hypothetical protein
MKILFFLSFTFSFLFSSNLFGQGGWNIGYLPIDSVGLSDIGRDVKLDFAGNTKFSSGNSNQVRTIVSPQDTAKILINEEEVELVEVRNIHSDWGFYNEQYLECESYSTNQTLRVYHTVIEDLKEGSIKFRLYVEVYPRNKKGKLYNNPKRWCWSLWIEKEKLSGLMIEN